MIKTNISLIKGEVVITENNIVDLSKEIAMGAIKASLKYAFGCPMQQMIYSLAIDIFHHKELDVYSSAYDLVQEASYFLCKYIGNKLTDVCFEYKSRKGIYGNIRCACFRHLYTYIRKQIKLINNEENDDELLEYVTIENEVEKELPNYSKVIEIATKIINTPLEREILKYFYNGASVNNIAEFLSINTDKVYKRRRKFKDRYALYFK